MREILVTTVCALILTPFVIFSLSIGFAQVMQSTSYRIQSDSINFGGGFSSSTNYNLESTGGEIANRRIVESFVCTACRVSTNE